MEEERVSVDRMTLTAWYADMGQRIDKGPRQFLFNVEEAACSDRGARREVAVPVPVR
jgi:hypothetical protein